MNLEKIQKKLAEYKYDGWLFYDFQNRDHLGGRILGLDYSKPTTRRWYYYIPVAGVPTRLLSVVERTRLDSLPGEKIMYLSWQERNEALKKILGTPGKVAMQYSPMNEIPYISTADAGTVELIRSFGHEVVSAADLVQEFESLIDENGYQSHVTTGKIVDRIRADAFQLIESHIAEGKKITEIQVANFILESFKENSFATKGVPIVGVNDHPADPHFEPTEANSREIKKGDMILIDLWAKKAVPDGIFYDITWCGYAGKNPPADYVKIFNIVRDSRDAAVELVCSRLSRKEAVYGWEVDNAARNVIDKAGYKNNFIHRTGHSIGRECHGNGVNIDNLETRDSRRLVPGICFSVEPGIYIEGKMGVRSELNVFIKSETEAVITGETQKELVLMNV
ncbi:MAG: M24 family metallopeptidase [Candidatus Riflebacteria bacterium]|nr:M24 family metallopeptidase [Candidatus Riflebacteria bacterium]